MLLSEKCVDALAIAVVAAGLSSPWIARPINKDPHYAQTMPHSVTAGPALTPRAQPLRHVAVPAFRA